MTTGWLLLPVGVNDGADPTDPMTYDFDNGRAWYDGEMGGAWGFIDSDIAPTFSDALAKMKRCD
jgi:hypothetical protein